ncbi:RNA polymerase factor sigma-54 [Alkalihalophilus lindianensis]|uniref:RNA polymerase factor sigma-54 n=1 Tax=Alkalihalophilus lindianensis TaxID=1630542 RepID=A0ABU3X8J5_9BACI|nr:RNA polymerase factor sigma-54 [Alkalihalophilus lindianensis]MDV2684211.1 RNA polymerase factor sigma-54 [Alkalihalophilus lindianensis]
MQFGLFQQQTTTLIMTQELRQAINLLQYSTTDLSAFIHEQALENPLMDLQDQASIQTGSESSYIEGSISKTKSYQKSEDEASPIDYALIDQVSLSEHLISQAGEIALSKEREKQLHYFIFSLREDGYFCRSFTEVCNDLMISEEEGEDVLRILQSFDPAGVGARSLQECLYLQLKRLSNKAPLAEMIVMHHMEDLASKKWKALAAELDVTLADIQDVNDLIQTLDPRPGTQFSGEPTNYLIPDLSITWKDSELVVQLIDDSLPPIRLNRDYEKLLKQPNQAEASEYAKQKYQQIQWLLKSIEQRQQTIKKVAEAIVRHQRAFFESKNGVLKPLTLKDIAEEIEMHESTVSRATTHKYAQTPRGLYELKAFFTSSVKNGFGESTSSQSIKELIKELVANESKAKPLSDQKIVTWLESEKGITVSRRAIAKYRDELGIPSSAKRKRYE